MSYTLDRVREEIIALLTATELISAEEIDLQVPKAASVKADLALPCFKAASARGIKNAAQLAQQLAEAANERRRGQSLIGRIEAAGPFLNFSIEPGTFAQQVVEEVVRRGDVYGCSSGPLGKTVLIEYSSPNIAKRMHAGHISTTIICQALVHLYKCLGYTVISDNHLGDYGKQFGVMIAAVKRFGRPEAEGEAALAALEEQYQRYNQLMSGKNPDDEDFDPDAEGAMDDEARSWSLKLEQGDPEAVGLWQWMVDLTKRANQRSYDRLGIRFDTQHGESFYKEMLGEIISDAGEAGIAVRDESGAVIVRELRDSKGRELPLFLLQRKDGGTLYLTRDVATVKWREEAYDPDMIVYVVGQPQELHFRQTFALARALGYSDAELVHVQFGTVFDQEGKPLSTRRGNMIYLESLLDEAHARARAVIEEKVAEGKTNLTRDEIAQVAEMVGVGAVIYNDLYQDTKRNITMDWNRMLSFEGNSAPYLQYMHARCRSILREAGGVPVGANASLLTNEAEQGLIKELARLPQVVRDAAERFAPSVVADWTYATARAFSSFYDACPVLRAETPELRAARLQLTAAAAQGLSNGLGLLGISAPERM